MKKMEVKIKHHYVSREHLRYWSTDRKNICYTTSKGNIACDGIAGLAMEKNFYRISPIDQRDKSFIDLFCLSQSENELKKENEGFLEDFIKVSNLLKISKKDKLDTARYIENNFLEDLYGSHERDISKIQKKLSLGEIEILNGNEEKFQLFTYIAHQALKTKTIRERLLSNFSKNILKSISLKMQVFYFYLKKTGGPLHIYMGITYLLNYIALTIPLLY